MLLRKRLLEQYTVGALIPYVALAALILTVSLLAQQTTRFAEIMGTARAPFALTLEILIDLLPNVLIFTLPMATLIGTATGFSRMGSDSELIAMHAAGVGTRRIVTPVLLTGAALSILTLLIGFEIAPAAAQNLRQAALQAALYKLESPVEPRSFYTEMPGKVVYVRDGDQVSGQWGRVFIYWQDRHEPIRLVTARAGRIDSSAEQSELVLSDAVVTTLPLEAGAGEAVPTTQMPTTQIMTERSAQLRIRDDRLDAGRRDVLRRLRERKPEYDEMGWQELNAQRHGAEDEVTRRNASIALHRRLALATAPLIFSLLGAAMGLRTRRGGRGLGVLLSLAAMLSYYLVSLAGEHLGRAGVLPVGLGLWSANFLSTAAGASLLSTGNRFKKLGQGLSKMYKRGKQSASQVRRGEPSPSLVLGLLDRSVLRSLGWNFTLTFAVLVSIFLIFTLFELLRFITSQGASMWLVLRYVFFLLPFVTVSLFPMSMLVSVLLTYALMSRRSEAIAWWSSGQSVFRLALPGLFFAALVGVGLWVIEEQVMPQANRRQNALRAQIREGISRTETAGGRQWLATTEARKLYAFEFEEENRQLKAPMIYEFDEEGVHLRRLVSGPSGGWRTPAVLTIDDACVVDLSNLNRVTVETTSGGAYEDGAGIELFKPLHNKPSEQSFKQLRSSIQTLKTRGVLDTGPLQMALERKRAEPFSPLVMALIGIPLAIAFGRRSAMTALVVAVAIGLAFWAAVSGFQQLGSLGLLPTPIAAWAPHVIFAAIGVYLLSRSRT